MRILSDKIVYPGPFVTSSHIKLIETEYLDNNGARKTWEWVSRTNDVKSVAIVAIVNDGEKKLAVIEEYRIPLKGIEIGLPAGLVEPGDDIFTTVTKELFQETNLIVENMWFDSPFLYNSPGLTNEQTAIAFVTATGIVSNKNTEASENITPRLLTIKEVIQLIGKAANGQIKIGFKAWFIFIMFASGQLGHIETIHNQEDKNE